MSKRVKASEQDLAYWEEEVKKYRTSNEGCKKYCEQRGIKYHQLIYRLRYYKDESNAKTLHKLIPVKIIGTNKFSTDIFSSEEKKQGKQYCSLEFGNGTRLNIESLEALEKLGSILRELS